jgi:hypothetical protein
MTVCEGVRGEVTHEGVPTTSECIMATVYDPGDDNKEKHTVYTVVCNVNTSLFDKGASCVRRFFKPDIGSYMVGMDKHASCCMSPHLYMFASLDPCPGIFVRGVKGKIQVTGKGIMKIKLQADGGNGT